MTDQLPPGPAMPGWVQAALMVQGPKFPRYCHRRYGNRFTLRLGRFGTMVYLADPADIRDVLHGDESAFHAGEANAPVLGRILGPTSVLVTDEQMHSRQRRRLAGPFHGQTVERLLPRMKAIAAADVAQWPVGEPIQALPHMRSVTLEVILQTVVGLTGEQRLAPMRRALRTLAELDLLMMAQFPFPRLGRLWPWRRLEESKRQADALLFAEIARSRRATDLHERADVLAALIRHREPDGTAMTDSEVRDQIVTLLLAGHETTATGLAWALERLVRNPDVLEKATDAARRGDGTYIDAVVAETLRCRPVVPEVRRVVAQDFNLGPFLIPAGAVIDASVALVHLSSRQYADPDCFDPQRFVGRRPDPAIWFPFGGGNRRHLGAAFAATEMRVVLSEILATVDLVPTAARPERARVRHVTLAPHAGALVIALRHSGDH
ncbi:MAG: cytochrome P450 [Acidimicrobiales bacterium]|nr:cytochrome P450 [Acidimicrobiales bacterium]